MRPAYKITANDNDITELIASRFIELRISDEVNQKSDLLEIRLDDSDNKIEVPSNNVELIVELGYDDKLEKVGVFTGLEIDFIGSPDIVIIRASGMNLRKGMKEPKTRSFPIPPAETIKFGDLMESIAKDNGYTALVDDFIAGIEFEHICQANESDWQLINRLVKHYDGFIKASGGKIVVAMRDGRTSLATQAQLPVVTVTRGDIEKWSLKLTDRTRYFSVIAKWYDKPSATMKFFSDGTGKPAYEMKEVFDSEDRAKNAASARLKRFQRLKKTGRVTMAGRTDLVALGTLVMKGFRQDVRGEYRITRVDHVLSAERGYRCNVEIEA